MGHVTDEEVNCNLISIYRPWSVLWKHIWHSKEVTTSNRGIHTSGIWPRRWLIGSRLFETRREPITQRRRVISQKYGCLNYTAAKSANSLIGMSDTTECVAAAEESV